MGSGKGRAKRVRSVSTPSLPDTDYNEAINKFVKSMEELQGFIEETIVNQGVIFKSDKDKKRFKRNLSDILNTNDDLGISISITISKYDRLVNKYKSNGSISSNEQALINNDVHKLITQVVKDKTNERNAYKKMVAELTKGTPRIRTNSQQKHPAKEELKKMQAEKRGINKPLEKETTSGSADKQTPKLGGRKPGDKDRHNSLSDWDELNELIKEFPFADTSDAWGNEYTENSFMSLQDKDAATNKCGDLADEFAYHCKKKGMKVEVLIKDTKDWGYVDRKHRGASGHVLPVITREDGKVYAVDWTAAQYGYKEFPMILTKDNNNKDSSWARSDFIKSYNGERSEPASKGTRMWRKINPDKDWRKE